jgi:transposase
MLADELDYVIGVDTHRDEHVLAVVTAPAGAVVARRVTGADPRGYREALRFAEELAAGKRAWAIEGTGSYGAGLARFLAAHGEAVTEVSRTPRTERRLAGKDDSLDAVRTARAALASETLALPRGGGRREALRVLLVARSSAVDVRRQALVQLRAVIVTAPEPLRQELRRLSEGKLLDRCSRLRRTSAGADELATRLVLRSLARRIQAATREAAELEREILTHARALAPSLLDERGIGPIVAAQTDRRLVPPRPTPLRSLLRPPRRRRTRPRLKRPNDPTQTQPRRRPPTQPRPPHHRPPPPPTRPRHEGLHRQADRRRQNPPRRHPPPQALPRPPPLPATRTEPLMT